MTMRYHVVYEICPEIGTGDRPRICEDVAESREGFYTKMNLLLNRNEDVLGVYITGTSCGDDTADARKFREFLRYLEERLK